MSDGLERIDGIPVRGAVDRWVLRFGYFMVFLALALTAVGTIPLAIAPGVWWASILEPDGPLEWVSAVSASLLWLHVYRPRVHRLTEPLHCWSREGMPPRKEFHFPRLRPARALLAFCGSVFGWTVSVVLWLATYVALWFALKAVLP